MQRSELIRRMNEMLLKELPQYKEQAKAFLGDIDSKRRLLRSLMNVRPPMTFSDDFLILQDTLLSQECEEKGVADVDALPTTSNPRIVLWQGDITTLKVDAIVNAANSTILGCFAPCHGCIACPNKTSFFEDCFSCSVFLAATTDFLFLRQRG